MKLEDLIFLEEEDVEAIHARVLLNGGGTSGLRDRGLFEAAVARPRSGFGDALVFPSLANMAAAYADGIVKNRPFFDANKRTGYASMNAFLVIHGYPAAEDERLPSYMQSLVTPGVERLPFEGLVEIVVGLMGGVDEPIETE